MKHTFKNVDVKNMLYERNEQAYRVHQFLNTVRAELKECYYFRNNLGSLEEIKVMKSNEGIIGFVDGMDYLLDENYIFNQMVAWYAERESVAHMDKKKRYAELFRLGIIKPYNAFCRYYKTGDEYQFIKCFRISNAIVNLNISGRVSYE